MAEREVRELLAIRIVTEHVLGEAKASDLALRQALNDIGESKCFDMLGLEVFRHMVRTDLAKLRSRRAEAVAELAALPKPPLH